MKLLLTACLLTLHLAVDAQKKDTVEFDPIGFKPQEKIVLPFSTVKVVDARFDRTNIGSMHKKVKKNSASLERVPAILPDSFHLFLPKLISNIVTYSKETDTLVVLFKQFRVVEHIWNSQNLNYEPSLLVKISASFFHSSKDSLTRIFSFNDLLTIKWPIDQKPAKDVLEEFRNGGFIEALQLLFNGKNWKARGPSYSKKSFEEGMKQRYQLPLFTDTVLKAGVYKTFKEFKSNNPSVLDVKIKMKKGEPIEITDLSGRSINLKEYWGVCAENKPFIFFREKIYALLPSDKSFRFRSYSQTDDVYGRIGFGESFLTYQGYRGNNVSKQYFYLNMDEEEIYLEEIFGNSKSLKANQKDLLK